MVRLIYTASIAYMIILSLHLPRDSESPTAPPQMSHFGGGGGKKNFGANAPTPSPQNLHQVSANAGDAETTQLENAGLENDGLDRFVSFYDQLSRESGKMRVSVSKATQDA